MVDIFSAAVVIIRGVALWIIAAALSAIPAALAILKLTDARAPTPDSFNILVVIGALSHLLLAVLLLVYAKRLARYVTRGVENSSFQAEQADYEGLQAVVFSALGAYILLYAIPTLLKIIALAFLPATGSPDGGLMFPPRLRVPLEAIVEEVARVALGLWLVLGSRGLVATIRGIWAKGRSAGGPE